MFAQIETNGASHIIIHVPHEGAEKSLPALAAMLEKNAVFMSIGYSETRIIEPKMSILLGDKVEMGQCRNEEVVIKVEGHSEILDDTFQIATPQVFSSNAKVIKIKDEELSKLRTELNFVKQQLQQAESHVNVLKQRLIATGNDDLVGD